MLMCVTGKLASYFYSSLFSLCKISGILFPCISDNHRRSWWLSQCFAFVDVCMSVSLALWKRPPRRSTRFRWTQTCGLGLTSGKGFIRRSRPRWPLFQKKSSMSESALLSDSQLMFSDCCHRWFIYWHCFYCGFWLSLCKIERWAVQLRVWAAGVEGRHKESHVSLEELCFVLLHTGRKMFSQVQS